MRRLDFEHFVLLGFIVLLVKTILSALSVIEMGLGLGMLSFYAVKLSIDYKKQLFEQKYDAQSSELRKEIGADLIELKEEVKYLKDKLTSAEAKLNFNSVARALRPGSVPSEKQ